MLSFVFTQKEPQQGYWGLVLANTTSMIGVLRGKICCGSVVVQATRTVLICITLFIASTTSPSTQ